MRKSQAVYLQTCLDLGFCTRLRRTDVVYAVMFFVVFDCFGIGTGMDVVGAGAVRRREWTLGCPCLQKRKKQVAASVVDKFLS